MKRRVLWTVVLMLGTALSASCGDDSGDGTGDKAGTGGGAGNSGPPKTIDCEAGEVACGTECCGVAPGVMAEACCADDFSGQCGMYGGFGSTRACVRAVENFQGCPSVTIPVINFTLPSCCTPEKMCGIDGSVFGMGGCTELGQAAMRAMQAIMMAGQSMNPPPSTDEDGGVSGAGGMSGGAGRTGGGGRMGFPGIMFPQPQACPAGS